MGAPRAAVRALLRDVLCVAVNWRVRERLWTVFWDTRREGKSGLTGVSVPFYCKHRLAAVLRIVMNEQVLSWLTRTFPSTIPTPTR